MALIPGFGDNRQYDNEWPVFYAVFDRIAPAANKYMATLFNTSATEKVIITRVLRENWQATAVTGVALEGYLARITTRTAGTAVTIRSNDTLDVLPAGIAADTNSTAVTENHIIQRVWASSEEIVLGGSLAAELGFETSGMDGNSIWHKSPGYRGLVLRQNQGISIRNVTSSTVGTSSWVIEFTTDVI